MKMTLISDQSQLDACRSCDVCSWCDILIHLAHSWPSFAARDGTQGLPVIGFIRSCPALLS